MNYEEHLGSIDSRDGGREGVLLHVTYLTPCDLYRIENSWGHTMTRHHKTTTSALKFSHYKWFLRNI